MKIEHTRKNRSAIKIIGVLLYCALLPLISGASASFHLGQDDEDAYATSTERRFDYYNAFLAGFRSQETLPSATLCTQYLEQSILIRNST